jgi:dTDP-4-dehydrorhamnose 3,5-epimerase-like enzyme
MKRKLRYELIRLTTDRENDEHSNMVQGDTRMSKYGLLNGNAKDPMRKVEGDKLIWDSGKEYVQIIRGRAASGTTKTVAAIRFDRGQIVKEIQ